MGDLRVGGKISQVEQCRHRDRVIDVRVPLGKSHSGLQVDPAENAAAGCFCMPSARLSGIAETVVRITSVLLRKLKHSPWMVEMSWEEIHHHQKGTAHVDGTYADQLRATRGLFGATSRRLVAEEILGMASGEPDKLG